MPASTTTSLAFSCVPVEALPFTDVDQNVARQDDNPPAVEWASRPLWRGHLARGLSRENGAGTLFEAGNPNNVLCMACATTIAPAIPNAAPEPAWLLPAGN